MACTARRERALTPARARRGADPAVGHLRAGHGAADAGAHAAAAQGANPGARLLVRGDVPRVHRRALRRPRRRRARSLR